MGHGPNTPAIYSRLNKGVRSHRTDQITPEGRRLRLRLEDVSGSLPATDTFLADDSFRGIGGSISLMRFVAESMGPVVKGQVTKAGGKKVFWS